MSQETNTSIKAAGSPLSQLLKAELSERRLRESEVVEVELLKKTAREAYFDLGRFGTGVVYGSELLNARDMLRDLEPGAKVAAKVVDLDGKDGYAELSLAEAGKQRLWQQVQDLQEAGEVIKMKISASNSGGLIGSILDLKAFLPVSQLSNDNYNKIAEGDRQKSAEELKTFIGQELNVKILSVNPRNNKLIVSEREIVGANVKELLNQYQVGQTIDGIVSGLADFGIFVRFADNPQIEGLVHISEIDHRIIDNPKEIMKLSEAVKVKIIDIKEGRVFLSLKALKEDPWAKMGGKYEAGQMVKGKVYKFTPFGSVIDLDEGLQGMIHVSEFGGSDEMKKGMAVGDEKEFLIDSVKPEEKRIILKLKK